MKKCPNCGACQECGHVTHTPPWMQPWAVPAGPIWSPPYPSQWGDYQSGGIGGNYISTINTNARSQAC